MVLDTMNAQKIGVVQNRRLAQKKSKRLQDIEIIAQNRQQIVKCWNNMYAQVGVFILALTTEPIRVS